MSRLLPSRRLRALIVSAGVLAALALPAAAAANPASVPTITSVQVTRDGTNNSATAITPGAGPFDPVDLYATYDCSGPRVGTGTAGNFSSVGIFFDVPAPVAAFKLLTAKYAGSAACSAPFPVGAPGLPVIIAVSPRSPSNATTVTVRGTTPGGSTVSLYGDAACSTSPLASAVSRAAFLAGVAITVPADADTVLYARASSAGGLPGACTPTGVTYTNDSTAPPRPILTGTLPASSSRSRRPRVVGTAEAGSHITVYAGAGCTGAPVGSGSAANLARTTGAYAGVSAGTVGAGISTFSATATDDAGNVSACTLTPIAYTAL